MSETKKSKKSKKSAPRIVTITPPADPLESRTWRAGFHNAAAEPGERWWIKEIDLWAVVEINGAQKIEPLKLSDDGSPIFLRHERHFAGLEAPGAGGFRAKVRADASDAIDARNEAAAEAERAEIHRMFNTPLTVDCGFCHETYAARCEHFRDEEGREIILVDGKLCWRKETHLVDPNRNTLRRAVGQVRCPSCGRFFGENQECVKIAEPEAVAP